MKLINLHFKFHFLKCGVLSLTLFLLSLPSQAQLSSFLKSIDEVEIQMGPGLVSLYNENITKDIRQLKIGYTAKLGLIHSFNKKFSLSTGLLYQRKGLKTKYQVLYYDPSIDVNNCKCTTSLGTTENNSNMDYISLAILLNVKVRETNFYINGGPFVGHLLKAQGERKNLWDNSYEINDIKYLYKKTDFGISLSIGYKFIIKEKTGFYIQIIDNYGLLNITNTKVSQTVTKTSSFSILVGLTISK